MFLLDSLTNTQQKISSKNKQINFYLCGPTVYNYIHIGNARPLINFDVLHRLLIWKGYQVNYIHNFTDIDDKIIAQAQKEKTSEVEIATFYIQAYNKNIKDLRILKPNTQPKVSDYIAQIIKFIQALVDQQDAYVKDGNVYFDVTKYSGDYGKIINLKKEFLTNQADNTSESPKKNHHQDFALWKNNNVGLTWDSPWGTGRPGWHTECVVFNQELFNHETIDIHAGGVDLKFPHHENERIQWIALNKKPLSKIWIHNGQLNINNIKMSKSLGNTWLLNDVLEQYSADILKFIILNNHYRSPINISENNFVQAKINLEKWKNKLQSQYNELQINKINLNFSTTQINQNVNFKKFLNFLEADLNTANAISVINNNIKLLSKKQSLTSLALLFVTTKKMSEMLGFHLELQNLSDNDLILLNEWRNHQANKNYQESDRIRKILMKKGIVS